MTPTSTTSTVATIPAMKPTISTLRVPTSTWLTDVLAQVGRAEPVSAHDGACTRSLLRAFGSYGATHGPMIAKST